MPVCELGQAAGAARGGQINYWPGFVDALSTLLLAIVFLISVFMVGQFFLSRELSGRDTVLDRLNRQISELTDLLSLERSSRRNIEENLTSLQTTLQRRRGRARAPAGPLESGGAAQAQARRAEHRARDRAAGDRPGAQPGRDPQPADRRHAPPARGARRGALGFREPATRKARPAIADLGSRLNVALAQRVQELARYPLRLLRPPAADPRQPPGCAHRRRPLRVPVGGALPGRPGDAAARRPRARSTASPAPWSSSRSRSRRTSPG